MINLHAAKRVMGMDVAVETPVLAAHTRSDEPAERSLYRLEQRRK
jgi:hypothetical protein